MVNPLPFFSHFSDRSGDDGFGHVGTDIAACDTTCAKAGDEIASATAAVTRSFADIETSSLELHA